MGRWIVPAFVLTCCATSLGIDFESANLLVTHDNWLYEYTRSGTRRQSFVVPDPLADNFRACDAVVDEFGRAHVRNTGYPWYDNYLSTLDPRTRTWRHTLTPFSAVFSSGDGDLSIRGNLINTNQAFIDITDLSATSFIFPGGGLPSEVKWGLDGLLYAITKSSRHHVRVADPSDLSLVREFELRDANGSLLNARGIAVRQDGQMFLADLYGRIHEYTPSGTLVRSVSIGSGSSYLNGIDIDAEGTLVLGNKSGKLIITNTDLDEFDMYTIGEKDVYVSFVSIPEPTAILLLALLGAPMIVRRRRPSTSNNAAQE